MFREMRQQAVTAGLAPLPAHRRLLAYERWGCSPLSTGFYLPLGCETVLFPGCAVAGSRPAHVLELLRLLQHSIPSLGVVLGCCAKPSQDLGCTEQAAARYGMLIKELAHRGLRQVLTVCPGCYAMFRQQNGPFEVRFIAEALIGLPLPAVARRRTVTVHDPCVLRNEEHIHKAVRTLLRQIGLTVLEMPHHGPRTFCCGEGGAVAAVCTAFAESWSERRSQEAGGLPVVTYCAGCATVLARHMQSVHLLDLLLTPAGKSLRVSRAPCTYLHRILLKQRLRSILKL